MEREATWRRRCADQDFLPFVFVDFFFFSCFFFLPPLAFFDPDFASFFFFDFFLSLATDASADFPDFFLAFFRFGLSAAMAAPGSALIMDRAMLMNVAALSAATPGTTVNR